MSDDVEVALVSSGRDGAIIQATVKIRLEDGTFVNVSGVLTNNSEAALRYLVYGLARKHKELHDRLDNIAADRRRYYLKERDALQAEVESMQREILELRRIRRGEKDDATRLAMTVLAIERAANDVLGALEDLKG